MLLRRARKPVSHDAGILNPAVAIPLED
jgi:hypothetical protein